MVHEHGSQGWAGMADHPGCPRVPRCLPPCDAQVTGGTQRRAGQHSAREREAEPGHRRAPRGGVGGAQPQDARPDQMAQPPAEGVAWTASVRPASPRAATTDQPAAR